MKLDRTVVQFLSETEPLYIHLAVSNSIFRPYSVRGFGVNIDENRNEISIYILKAQSERILSLITSGKGLITCLFTDGFSNESYQIKGRFKHFRPACDELDLSFLNTYRQKSLRLFPKMYEKFPVSAAICDVITYKAEDIYIQTPGPYAGTQYCKEEDLSDT